jgi:membrane protein YdbS with pleckstrin-like domain
MKMADEKLTADKVLLIVVLTIAAVVPGLALYFAIFLLTYPFIGFYAVILSISIIVVPLLLATAYRLKKWRTKK